MVSPVVWADSNTELIQLNQQIHQLRDAIQQAEDQQNHISRVFKSNTTTLQKSEQRLTELRQYLAKQEAAFSILEQERNHQQERLAQQHVLLVEQLRAAYGVLREKGANTRWLPYTLALSQARFTYIHQVAHTLGQLNVKQQKMAKAQGALQNTVTKQQQAHAKLATISQNQQTVLNQLSSQIESKNAQLHKLLADKQALDQLVSSLNVPHIETAPASAAEASFVTLKGKLPWPTAGNIFARFGSRIGQSQLRYTGVLIGALPKQPVQAVYAGHVVFASWLQGLGLLLIIDHDNGYMTLYGHNQLLYKKVGDSIKAGDWIAAAGSSGGLGRDGLYFEIRHNGQPVDPEIWCTTKKG